MDPPIAVVSRSISSFNAVTSCRRNRNEDLGTFVSRFHSLAPDHIMHGGLSSSSQVGIVITITLLNNVNLSEETLTSAKLQLISLAQARDSEEENKPPPAEESTKVRSGVEGVCTTIPWSESSGRRREEEEIDDIR